MANNRMMQIQRFTADYLENGLDVLRGITPEQYKSAVTAAYPESTLGMHWRHILNIPELLLDPNNSERVNYTLRIRNGEIETSQTEGISHGETLIDKLRDKPLEDHPLVVTGEDGAWSNSSLARELNYVREHTTHHYALMRIILHENGITYPTTFGYAATTPDKK